MTTRKLDISDFAAHCVDELAAVEKGSTLVEVVRDGHVIAYISPAPKPKANTGTMADWVGSGAGFTLAAGCTLEDPAWEPEEWEEFPDSDDLSQRP